MRVQWQHLTELIAFLKLSILARRPSELSAEKVYLVFYLLLQCI